MLLPEPALYSIDRAECEIQDTQAVFDNLQNEIAEMEKELKIALTAMHNDSCNLQKAVRDIYDEEEGISVLYVIYFWLYITFLFFVVCWYNFCIDWYSAGCGSHAIYNGCKYILNIEFFDDIYEKTKKIHHISNCKSSEFIDKWIIWDRIKTRRMKIFNNNVKLLQKYGSLDNYVESEEFETSIQDSFEKNEERVGWIETGTTRKWSVVIDVMESVLDRKIYFEAA